MRLISRSIVSHLSRIQQNNIKKWYYRRQIKKNKFCSAEPEFENLEQFVKTGDWIIDIGANIGHYTLKFSALVGSMGHIIAFEPVSDTFEILTSNTYYSRYDNITLFNTAVSDESNMYNMEIPKFDSGMKNYYEAHLTDNFARQGVICISIDSLDLPRSPSLVKIDVEGHELKVLEGMKNLIGRAKPTLIIEGKLDMYNKFLNPFGYSGIQHPRSPNCIYTLK